MTNAFLKIENLEKIFHGKTKLQVLDGININVNKGEIVSFIGPNSCGKSTLFDLIANELVPDKGTITINGKSPKDIDKSYILQQSGESLFPWLNCWENISFTKIKQNLDNNTRKKLAEELVKELGFDKILTNLEQFPAQLSGGQKQACNVARAIMNEPEILLIDEGSASLDFETASILEQKLSKIISEKKLTTLIITHRVEEAVFLSDRIYVMSPKPSKIVGIVDVPINRPRTNNFLTSTEFSHIRKQVIELFWNGVGKN